MGEGDLKLSLVTYFQQVKIPDGLGPNSVTLKSQTVPLVLVGGHKGKYSAYHGGRQNQVLEKLRLRQLRSRWGWAHSFLNSTYKCFTVKTGKQKHVSYLTKNKGTLKLVKDNIFIWMIWQSCHRSVTCYKESLRIITFIRPVTLSFSHTFLTSVPLQRQFSFLK